MRQKDKRVLFVAEPGGINARPLYRAVNPAKGLVQHGFDVRVCPILYEQEDHTFNGYCYDESERPSTPKYIIAHTFMSPTREGKLAWESQAQIIETARVHGQRFLFDLDDDIWNIPDWNPASSPTANLMGNYPHWISDVNSSDGLIVSTNSIAESAKKSGEIKVPISVITNSIDVTQYNPDHKDHSPLRIGWIGDLDYRLEDFKLIIPTLYHISENKRNEIEFWHIGANFASTSIRDILKRFPVDIVERPWVPAFEFYKAIESIDILLCPCADHPFNNGRSNAIAMAAIAGGIPFISSRAREFCSFSLALAEPEDWHYELTRLIENSRYRREVVSTELPYIQNFDTPKKRAEDYIRLFEELC